MKYGIENIQDDVKIIYVFGNKKNGRKCANGLKRFFPNTCIRFIDNSVENSIDDTINPAKLEYEKNDYCVYVYSLVHYDDMYKQLKSLNCPDERIIFSNEILEKEYYKTKKIIDKRIPPKKIDLVYDLVEHCNLNCQNCDHFSSIASPWYADINEYQRDLYKLVNIMGDDGTVTNIFLAGGEPLLHDNIIDFIIITHQTLHNSNIIVFTNGLLVNKMNEAFWDTCKTCNVTFYVTKYPINLDYSEVANLISDHGLKCVFQPNDTVRYSMHKPLDLEGEQDIYNSFDNCYMGAGTCTTLKQGKLYMCTLVPNIKIFNRFFGKGLSIDDKDYLDLDKIKTKQDVMQFLCNPVPACKYCKVNEWTYNNEWKISRKLISEWT